SGVRGASQAVATINHDVCGKFAELIASAHYRLKARHAAYAAAKTKESAAAAPWLARSAETWAGTWVRYRALAALWASRSRGGPRYPPPAHAQPARHR